MSLTIDFAERAQREAIFRLRYRIYVVDQSQRADNADHDRGTLTDADDEHAHLLGAWDGDRLVGTLRICCGADGPFSSELIETFGLEPFIEAVGTAQLMIMSRFMVRPEFRGGSAPFDLMLRAARFGAQRGVPVVFCDCQPHLIGLYTRLGFRAYRSAYSDPSSGLLVPLVLIADDRDYLAAIDWPLANLLGDVAEADPDRCARLLTLLSTTTPPVRSQESADATAYFSELFGLLNAEAASDTTFFADLSDTEIERIVARSHILDCQPGDVVIRRNHVTRTIFAVLSGALEVRNGERLIGVSVPGEAVGEVAFLMGTRRMHDVCAGPQGARLISLNEKTLQQLIDGEPKLAARLLLNLARGLCRKLLERSHAPAWNAR